MNIDPAAIELTPIQKVRLAAIAERLGKDCSALVDDLLDAVALRHAGTASGIGPKNLLEVLEAIGAVGCFDGPPDLSVDPKHMAGFGQPCRPSPR